MKTGDNGNGNEMNIGPFIAGIKFDSVNGMYVNEKFVLLHCIYDLLRPIPKSVYLYENIDLGTDNSVIFSHWNGSQTTFSA